jgi:drug/metabolite transporter (DMT)-like permease
MNSVGRARLRLVAAGALFATGGAAIKACSFPAWQVASLRSAIAVVTIVVLMPQCVRGLRLGAIPAACAYAATLSLFVVANKLTTAASAIFLQATAPLYLLVLGPWLLRERLRRRDVAVIAVLATGMVALLFGGDVPRETAPDPVAGDLLAAISGATWAATVLSLRGLARRGPEAAAAAVLGGNLLAAAFGFCFAVPLVTGSASDWIWIAYLGVAQVGLAYWLVTRALPHLRAFEAALILMVEPALNPVIAWLVHGEVPNGPTLAGGSIVLVALLLQALPAGRRHCNQDFSLQADAATVEHERREAR